MTRMKSLNRLLNLILGKSKEDHLMNKSARDKGSVVNRLNDILSPFANKIGNQRHLKAVSTGMMFGLPFIVIGSFFLIFANPPINIDQYDPAQAGIFMKFLAAWKEFAVANYDVITAPYNLTMGIIGLISVFGIAYSLSNEYKLNLCYEWDGQHGDLFACVYAG